MNQSSDFPGSGGSEKVLLLAMTFSHLFNLEKLCLEFPIFSLYLPRLLNKSLKKEKRKTNHPSVGMWQGGVVVAERGKCMKLQKRKFTIIITQSFLAVKSISFGFGKCWKYYP